MTPKSSLIFEARKNSFLLTEGDGIRVVFGELTLCFRTTRVRLSSGGIMPEPAVRTPKGTSFPCRIRAMGSLHTARLAEVSVALETQAVGDAMLISLANRMRESRFSPDEAVTLTATRLPGVVSSVFYHNRSNEFQNFDCEGLWWCQTVFRPDPARDLAHEWGLLSLWKYEDGRIGGMLPVANQDVIGRLRGDASGLSAIAADFKSGTVVDEYPLALFALGDSPTHVRDRLLASAAALSAQMTLRDENRPAPPPFNKLGWCSWNAFGQAVEAEDIRRTAAAFKDAELPVRYMLLDDGWLHHEQQKEHSAAAEGITGQKLVDYEPDPRKFPGGIRELVDEVKRFGIQDFGLWHAFNGYWGGIAPDSPLIQQHPERFFTTPDDTVLPEPGSCFFARWYKLMKSWGVDFIKVDNQGFYRRLLPYVRNLPEYAAAMQAELQQAAKQSGFPVINCMATHLELLFNSATPENLLRVTNDFVPNDDFSARLHLVNNFYNAFWLANVLCPDFDMFQTNDVNSEAFAKMLALSLSPIYTTDKPGDINTELLRKLVMPDGNIPRFDQPAKPLEDAFFENPYADGNLLTVAAKSGNITTVGLFNTAVSGTAASRVLTPKSLGYDSPCFVYSQGHRLTPRLEPPETPLRIHLKGLASDLLTLSPASDGFAPVGVVDYFAAPALIDSWTPSPNGFDISLKAPGTFMAYCASEPRLVTGDAQPLEQVDGVPVPENGWQWVRSILLIRTRTSTQIKVILNPDE